ncbi:glycosyltransferase [Sphingomonas sp. PR090111-T3T-6A]|uniref:glycosyltransferase n=1 Tax=Sphingomonas sp. PR090111-T3T-6A TaxID=685778 RepID=UPI000475B689|nr:glycosyltransferase [Sphingomonas sp. PR090111-T3T-6A]
MATTAETHPISPAQRPGTAALRAPSRLRAAGQDVPAPVRIAYLTNAYPKISHSFIRDEILALEQQGVSVLRFSVRPSPEAPVDPLDLAEQRRTEVLLDGRRWSLLGAMAARAIRSPRRFAVAAREAFSISAGPVRAVAYLAEACRLAARLEAEGIRHVHVHFGTNPAAVARLASLLGRVGYSMTVHGPEEFDAPRSLHLDGKIAGARFVAAVSHYGRGQLLRWSAPRDWGRINVVRCGTAAHFLRDVGEDDGAGLASRTLVCVARLSAQKGIPLLIEAAAMVARDRPFTLRIIGDGEMRPEIEAQIRAADLEGHVHLLGWQGRDVIVEEIRAARAFVLPSFAEGLPVVLMEALALGRPAIATAVAGIPELVDDRAGWLIPAGSATALAEAMRAALATDRQTLAAMGAEGRARVLRDHDVHKNAAGLAALLRPLA